MKKLTKKLHANERRAIDLKQLLNLEYLNLTNKTHMAGAYDLPAIYCNTDTVPDYLALYVHPLDYHHTAHTGVCFYNYDRAFDGIHGLFNAIYYHDTKLLQYYQNRFQNVRYLISPDYSVFGDLQMIENHDRLWKARIVSLWFAIALGAVVIPNITYTKREEFPLCFEGLQRCSVVAFSTKGHMKNQEERKLLQDAVRYAVDHLPLKTIVVYSVCAKDETVLPLFSYATEKGIRVVIPNNALKERNARRNAR